MRGGPAPTSGPDLTAPIRSVSAEVTARHRSSWARTGSNRVRCPASQPDVASGMSPPGAAKAGRAAPRYVLWRATLVATRGDPVLRARYDQLRQRGRPRKVAIVACMRRLPGILHAIARTGTPWKTA